MRLKALKINIYRRIHTDVQYLYMFENQEVKIRLHVFVLAGAGPGLQMLLSC